MLICSPISFTHQFEIDCGGIRLPLLAHVGKGVRIS